MLNIWDETGAEATARMIEVIRVQTGQTLAAGKCRLLKCRYQPYEDRGWFFYRLNMAEQWMGHPDQKVGNVGIAANSYAHLLVRGLDTAEPGQVNYLPLSGQADDIHAFNRIIGLKLTRETAPDYLMFFGQCIFANGSNFLFFDELDHIGTIAERLEPANRQKLLNAVEALFRCDAEGNIETRLAEKGYGPLGRAFTLSVPTLYKGVLFSSALRISENGQAEMDEDHPTTIAGLDIANRPDNYVVLAKPVAVFREIARAARRRMRPIRLFNAAMAIEKVVFFVLLPMIVLFGAFLWRFGMENDELYAFFELATRAGFLNWLNLVVGALLVAVGFLRFSVFQIGAFTATLVPNRIGTLMHQTKQELGKLRGRMGLLVLLFVTIPEMVLISLLSLSMLVYGIEHVIFPIVGQGNMNFIDALLTVGGSFGLVSEYLGLGAGRIGRYEVATNDLLSWALGFYVSTIIVGLGLRLVAMARAA